MNKKRPHITRLDQIRLARHGEDAIIDFLDPATATTRAVGQQQFEKSLVRTGIGPGVIAKQHGIDRCQGTISSCGMTIGKKCIHIAAVLTLLAIRGSASETQPDLRDKGSPAPATAAKAEGPSGGDSETTKDGDSSTGSQPQKGDGQPAGTRGRARTEQPAKAGNGEVGTGRPATTSPVDTIIDGKTETGVVRIEGDARWTMRTRFASIGNTRYTTTHRQWAITVTLKNNADVPLEFGRDMLLLEVNDKGTQFTGALVQHGLPDAQTRWRPETTRIDALRRACGLSQFELRFVDDWSHYGGTYDADCLNRHSFDYWCYENKEDSIPDSLGPHESWPLRFHWNQGNWLINEDGNHLLVVLPEIRIREAGGKTLRCIAELGKRNGRHWSIRRQTVISLQSDELLALLQSTTTSAAIRTLAANWLLETDRKCATKAIASVATSAREGDLLFSLLEVATQEKTLGLESHAIGLLEDGKTPAGIRLQAVRYLGAMRHDPATPALVSVAGSQDDAIAKVAVNALGELAGPAATDALLVLLRDATRAAIQSDVAAALAHCKKPGLSKSLQELADAGNTFALAALEDVGSADSFGFLRQRLTHDERPSEGLIRGVVRSGGKQAVPLLLPLLEKESEPSSYSLFDRSALVDALATLSDPSAVPPLVGLAKAGKLRAVQVLAGYTDASARQPLFEIARAGKTDDARTIAVHGLATHWPAKAVSVFKSALTEGNEKMLLAAIEGIANTKDASLAPSLLPLLKNTNDEVVLAASKTLSAWGYQEAVPILIGAWHGSYREEDALRVWDEYPYLNTYLAKAAQSHPSAHSRQVAVLLLGQMRARAGREALLASLHDPDPKVRAEGIGAVTAIRERKAIPRLAELTADSNQECRVVSLRALGKYADPTTIDAVARCARDPKDDVRAAAGRALGAMNDSRVVEPLLLIAKRRGFRSQPAAMIALARWDDPRAIPIFIEALDSYYLQDEASDALRDFPKQAEVARRLIASVQQHKIHKIRLKCVELLAEIKTEEARAAVLSMLRAPDTRICQAALEALGRRADAQSVPVIVAILRHENASLRIAAVGALSKIAAPAAIDAIQAALKDADENVRVAAIQAIAASDSFDNRDNLISGLDDKKESVRKAAAKALGSSKRPSDPGPLISALGDDSEKVRRAAATGLGNSTDPSAIAALIDAMDGPAKEQAQNALHRASLASLAAEPLAKSVASHPKAIVRASCLQLLGKLKAKQHLPAVIAALRDQDNEVRLAAIAVLSTLADRSAGAAIAGLLGDQDPRIRLEALKALQTCDPTATKAILTAAKDQDENVRCAAADALGSLSELDEIGPLVSLLSGKGESCKRSAAALGKLGDKRAVPSLVEALSGVAAEEARKSLQKIADRKQVIDALVDAVQKHQDSTFRQACARTLGEMKARDACEALGALLDDRDATVRSTAIEALGELRMTRAASLICRGLRDESTSVRIAALRSLQKFGDPRGVTVIQARLEDKDDQVRAAAAEALTAFDSIQVPKPLIDLLTGPGYSSRQAAARALCKIGDASTLPALIDAMADIEYVVRDGLRQFKDKTALTRELAKAVQGHNKTQVRRACVSLLGELAPDTDMTLLLPALSDADAEVRKGVIEALVRRNAKAAAPHVAKLFHDPDRGVRKEAIEAIQRFADPSTQNLLRDCLKDPDNDVRAVAVDSLKSFRNPATIADFLVCLGDKEDCVREKALEALSTFDSFRDPLPIIDALKRGGSSTQRKAADLLGRIGDARGIAPLIETLPESGYDGRRALSAFDDQELVIAELAKRLQSASRPAVRAACLDQLAEMRAKEVLSEIQKAARDTEKSVAEAAQKAVKAICGE